MGASRVALLGLGCVLLLSSLGPTAEAGILEEVWEEANENWPHGTNSECAVVNAWVAIDPGHPTGAEPHAQIRPECLPQ